MAVDAGLIEWVREALEPMGSITTRPMMGGVTFYCDGTVFAIAAFDELWFKADAASDAIWDAEGCDRFIYEMGEWRVGSMNYRRAPADVYDDADAMRHWAALAIEAGLRAPPKKPRRAKRPPA